MKIQYFVILKYKYSYKVVLCCYMMSESPLNFSSFYIILINTTIFNFFWWCLGSNPIPYKYHALSLTTELSSRGHTTIFIYQNICSKDTSNIEVMFSVQHMSMSDTNYAIFLNYH